MAGTHDFVVPDEQGARAFAEELAAFGFPEVVARPCPDGGWWVIALDAGPYPVGTVGHRQIDAVNQVAAGMARTHGGRPDGGSRFDVSAVDRHRSTTSPVFVTGTKDRPPIPEITIESAPPPATLAFTPDIALRAPVELAGLDDVPWADLDHAHGSAEDIPDLLRALAGGTEDRDEILDELFGDNLLHQGDCYAATAPALPFLTQLIVSDTLPAAERRTLYLWLLVAAGRRNDNLVGFAGLALAEHRLPEPGAWTEDVFRTVGDQLPMLLDRWDAEPPAVRYVLACLAALHPRHGVRVADRIAAMTGDVDGTQQGAYLRLATELVNGHDAEALALATQIVGWAEHLEPEWLEAPGVPDGIKAAHVLAEGALHTIEPVTVH